MILILVLCIAAMAFFLALVTLVQMLYLETLRLRTRELPFLQFFKETYENRIGLKADQGALSFSLIKHTLLALSGVLCLALTTQDERISTPSFLEACALACFLMLFTTYVIPQLLYRRTSGGWLLAFTPILVGLTVLVRPLTWLFLFFQSLMNSSEKAPATEETSASVEDIAALISAGTEEGIFEEEDRKLIQSAVAFGSKTVRDVMTPRPSMVSASADCTLEDLRQLVIHEQFSRIPVYEGSIDHIVGFVHVRDMFELDYTERVQRTVRELARALRYVPETKPVNDLLREMQQDGAHMAIVIDEYGNTAGLATMEDMVEELVGEIRDEHEPGHDVQTDAEGAYIVSGSFDLDHLQELLEFRAQEGMESTTIGGLVTEWMGRVPQTGESVEREGIKIEVLAGSGLRVEQVRISKTERAQHV